MSTLANTRIPPSRWPHPDSPRRYGTLSRLLHWSMALCFAVSFTTAAVHYFAAKSPLDQLLFPSHKPVGALLMLLVVLRILWSLANAVRRPSSISAAARWGHRALYLLMVAVPCIALMRQFGSGRAFAPFGLPLMADRPDARIGWMIDLGGLLHGELGWVLFALVVGHVAMAIRHRGTQDHVLPRMIG